MLPCITETMHRYDNHRYDNNNLTLYVPGVS